MSERSKKHWVKPPTKIYDYNYDYGEGYYKPMVDHLRRKDQGSKEKPPGASTFAERVAVYCPGCHGRHKPGEPHYKPRERDVSPERVPHVKKTSSIDEFDSKSFDSDSPKRERFPNLSDWFDKDENEKHAPNSNIKFKMQDWMNANNDLRPRHNRNAFFDNDQDEFKKNRISSSSHRFDDETKAKDDSYRATHEFQSHIETGSQLPNRRYKYVSDVEDSSTIEVKKKTHESYRKAQHY